MLACRNKAILINDNYNYDAADDDNDDADAHDYHSYNYNDCSDDNYNYISSCNDVNSAKNCLEIKVLISLSIRFYWETSPILPSDQCHL